MIHIKKDHLDHIETHGKEGFPNEVCGIILGVSKSGKKEALKLIRGTNLNSDRSHDRYELDPKDLLKAERDARDSGMEIIGFYHSHPDHPDTPSEFDRERAWPDYSYIISSIMGGKEASTKSWLLNDESHIFEEEKIIVSGA
ncbi:MAG: M67 family metallopeptidase [bacterium]|nr:M67 family metallopeptidase [bacterium]